MLYKTTINTSINMGTAIVEHVVIISCMCRELLHVLSPPALSHLVCMCGHMSLCSVHVCGIGPEGRCVCPQHHLSVCHCRIDDALNSMRHIVLVPQSRCKDHLSVRP